MHWKQLQKLRELCEAAQEGGLELVMDVAKVMKSDFDSAFCNFLNFEIEQEEGRLRGLGIEPVGETARWLAFPPAKEDGERLAVANTSPEAESTPNGVEEQQWLLVLRVVKQGVYALLARERDEDIKQVRNILNLASPESRRDLTLLTLEQLSPEEAVAFKATIARIRDNLSVQRDARDADLFSKVSQLQQFIEEQSF
eukprot:CAMPEP_0119382566 /NCGR_PEP_ID=MMETSP1334-20130426/73297_1 /TAXON_ID=127549 /ORGANISM="Calcidiscus leptoporus, Strain RCC1130" /LENGTH=197 /DNA_ID=CAMNT_0007403079 /DNA_START=27 /DNA_END=620 /DNA_ORIENTATION=+